MDIYSQVREYLKNLPHRLILPRDPDNRTVFLQDIAVWKSVDRFASSELKNANARYENSGLYPAELPDRSGETDLFQTETLIHRVKATEPRKTFDEAWFFSEIEKYLQRQIEDGLHPSVFSIRDIYTKAHRPGKRAYTHTIVEK